MIHELVINSKLYLWRSFQKIHRNFRGTSFKILQISITAFRSFSLFSHICPTSSQENRRISEHGKHSKECEMLIQQAAKWYMESRREGKRRYFSIVQARWRWRRGIRAVALENWAFNVTTRKSKDTFFRSYLPIFLIGLLFPHFAIDSFSAHISFFITFISLPIASNNKSEKWASEKLFLIRFNYLQRRFFFSASCF